uniref:GYF domain-containing protein n=1 Tax=Populus trichocarpa TaxID=3694 RepID=A0A2K1ZDK8_POPTR
MSSMKDFAMDHQTQQQQPYSGAGNGHDGSYNRVAEVGWFILGEDQQQVGPYTFSELSGEFDRMLFLSYLVFKIRNDCLETLCLYLKKII